VKPSGPLTRRSRLKPVSEKRAVTFDARRACVATVLERDGVCQWPVRERETGAAVAPSACYGPLTAHEPAGRRNVDPTDPDACVALCAHHNTLCEDRPNDARLLGLRPANRAAW
jgi:hypothetical protein